MVVVAAVVAGDVMVGGTFAIDEEEAAAI